MAAVESELKKLITRLAKKEVKLALKRGQGLRKDNQSLRARIQSLESNITRMMKSISKSSLGVSVPKPGEEKELKRLRFTAKGIKALRRKTRLSQAQFGKLVGASTLTVSNWELGKALPRKSSDAFRKLVEIRNNNMGAREAKRILDGMDSQAAETKPETAPAKKPKRSTKKKIVNKAKQKRKPIKPRTVKGKNRAKKHSGSQKAKTPATPVGEEAATKPKETTGGE